MAASPTRGGAQRSRATRKLANGLFVAACTVCTGIALILPGGDPGVADRQGDRRGEPAGLHHEHARPGIARRPGQRHRGLADAVRLRMVIAVIVGVLAGTWLAEYAAESPYGKLVRFTNDVLLSAPSILIGLFIYQLAVRPARVLRLRRRTSPGAARRPRGHAHHRGRAEAAIPPAPRKRRGARRTALDHHPQDQCGVRLAAASSPAVCWPSPASPARPRPCCSTSLNNQFFSWDMTKPMANLPTIIFNYALSAYDDWQRLAWVGALLITLAVLGANIVVRALSAEKKRS